MSGTTRPCPTCGQGVVAAECVCGHIVYAHDLSKQNERTACSASDGPQGVKCPCRRYEQAEVAS